MGHESAGAVLFKLVSCFSAASTALCQAFRASSRCCSLSCFAPLAGAPCVCVCLPASNDRSRPSRSAGPVDVEEGCDSGKERDVFALTDTRTVRLILLVCVRARSFAALGALKASLLLTLRLRACANEQNLSLSITRSAAFVSCLWQYAQALLGVLLLGALKAHDGDCKDGACKDGACDHGACVTGRYEERSAQLHIVQPRHGEILRKHEAGLGIAFQGRPMP